MKADSTNTTLPRRRRLTEWQRIQLGDLRRNRALAVQDVARLKSELALAIRGLADLDRVMAAVAAA